MSFETITDYWNYFILAPIAFISGKMFSYSARIAVNTNDIQTLKETCKTLCEEIKETNKEAKETNRILNELNGKFDGHFRHD